MKKAPFAHQKRMDRRFIFDVVRSQDSHSLSAADQVTEKRGRVRRRFPLAYQKRKDILFELVSVISFGQIPFSDILWYGSQHSQSLSTIDQISENLGFRPRQCLSLSEGHRLTDSLHSSVLYKINTQIQVITK